MWRVLNGNVYIHHAPVDDRKDEPASSAFVRDLWWVITPTTICIHRCPKIKRAAGRIGFGINDYTVSAQGMERLHVRKSGTETGKVIKLSPPFSVVKLQSMKTRRPGNTCWIGLRNVEKMFIGRKPKHGVWPSLDESKSGFLPRSDINFKGFAWCNTSWSAVGKRTVKNSDTIDESAICLWRIEIRIKSGFRIVC